MDDFEPTPDDRARALRAAEDILMPGHKHDSNRFWFMEGWLSREAEIAKITHRLDIEKRLNNCLIATAKFEADRVHNLIQKLELSGDGYVQYALKCYRAATLDE
jgi:hypothetical protein